MKKVFTLFFVAGIMSIISCGPSAEEKTKLEVEKKAKMDSLFEAASKSITEAKDSIGSMPAKKEEKN